MFLTCTSYCSRICARQTRRPNVEASGPEEYFRRVIFIPFVDHFLDQLESRFNERLSGVIPVEGLIPAKLHKYSVEEIVSAGMVYELDHQVSKQQLFAEVVLWKNRWEGQKDLVATAIEALPFCNNFYPSIKKLLTIFATLPVTTATAERSFSCLKRLKTDLRSTMTEERLNGLALLNIHKGIDVSIKNVIDRFASQKPRRMQLKDWSTDYD